MPSFRYDFSLSKRASLFLKKGMSPSKISKKNYLGVRAYLEWLCTFQLVGQQLTSLQHTQQRKLYSHCILRETNGNSSSHCCLYLVLYFAAPPTLMDFTRLAFEGGAAIWHYLRVRNCTSCTAYMHTLEPYYTNFW